jgi:hypothetical protein
LYDEKVDVLVRTTWRYVEVPLTMLKTALAESMLPVLALTVEAVNVCARAGWVTAAT